MQRIPPLVLALGLLCADAAAAGSVFVTTENPRTGVHHARVDVGRSCDTDHVDVPAGTLAGDQTWRACSTLAADDVEVTSGTLVLQAGEQVAFGSGFSVGAGASLVVQTGHLARGEGVVEDRSPDRVAEYHARFFLDATALDLAEGERFEHFLALDAGGSPELVLGIRHAEGSTHLFLEAAEDHGPRLSSEGADELVLLPGWQSVEISWWAATGVDDGRAEACLGKVSGASSQCITLSGLDNDAGRIDSVLWGAHATPRAGMGFLDLDDFASWEAEP